MRPVIRDLIHDVATAFGLEHLTEDEFCGRDRHKTIAEARAVAIWCARVKLRLSFPELGREFGNRDHTTCMSAVRKIEREIRTNPSGFLAESALSLVSAFEPTARPGIVSTNGARELSIPLGYTPIALGDAE